MDEDYNILLSIRLHIISLRAVWLFFLTLIFNSVIPFPNHLYYPNTIPKKINPRFFTGGLRAKPPSYLIVSCQNWKAFISWRYDFLNI